MTIKYLCSNINLRDEDVNERFEIYMIPYDENVSYSDPSSYSRMMKIRLTKENYDVFKDVEVKLVTMSGKKVVGRNGVNGFKHILDVVINMTKDEMSSYAA